MSTTIVLAALVGEKLYVMHLGDSRAYLKRGDALTTGCRPYLGPRSDQYGHIDRGRSRAASGA